MVLRLIGRINIECSLFVIPSVFLLFLATMKRKYRPVLITALLAIALLIHFFSGDPQRVEGYYSTGIYMYISTGMRFLFGWLPFSLGDLLYGFFISWIGWRIVKGVKLLFTKRLSKPALTHFLIRIFIQALFIYIFFNLFWGINYNRKGIASQLGLQMAKYSPTELVEINGVLLKKVNESRKALLPEDSGHIRNKQIFKGALDAYKELNKQYVFLQYYPTSVKSSIWGWLGNYTGFLGYYNPFTGEAQVNTTVPKFSQPYTTCHEIAHQLGYAKENEANFVGYLAAAASRDTFFHYSVYLDLFLYADRNLFSADSAAAKSFAKQLIPEVKADLKEWSDFNDRHRNPAEPVIRWMYGKYLQSNQQPLGVLSYDEVTGFLIAYYKKYGRL